MPTTGTNSLAQAAATDAVPHPAAPNASSTSSVRSTNSADGNRRPCSIEPTVVTEYRTRPAICSCAGRARNAFTTTSATPAALSNRPLRDAHTFTQRFSSSPRGARLARRLAVLRLDRWCIPPGSELLDVAALVVADAVQDHRAARPSSGSKQARSGTDRDGPAGEPGGDLGSMTVPAEQVLFLDHLVHKSGHGMQQAVPIA